MSTPTTTRRDPLPVFCFLVRFTSLPGNVETFFKSASGLRAETEIVPVRAGGANDTTFNLVGAMKWSPLVPALRPIACRSSMPFSPGLVRKITGLRGVAAPSCTVSG